MHAVVLLTNPARPALDADRVAALCQDWSGDDLRWLAEGEADLYPRFGRTMEWDTAAAQALLEAAGGRVLDMAGAPFRYGKPGFENGPFIAWGRGDGAQGQAAS